MSGEDRRRTPRDQRHHLPLVGQPPRGCSSACVKVVWGADWGRTPGRRERRQSVGVMRCHGALGTPDLTGGRAGGWVDRIGAMSERPAAQSDSGVPNRDLGPGQTGCGFPVAIPGRPRVVCSALGRGPDRQVSPLCEVGHPGCLSERFACGRVYCVASAVYDRHHPSWSHRIPGQVRSIEQSPSHHPT